MIRKLHPKHLLTLFVGVLPKEVSKCSWFTHQARMFSILFNEGQMLAFTGAGASLQELLTLLGWGAAAAGRNVLGWWLRRDQGEIVQYKNAATGVWEL